MKKELIVRLHGEFEQYAHTENEVDYWLARDLQKLLGYSEWRNFKLVIDKAKKACENSNVSSHDHFVDVNKMVTVGSGAPRDIDNIKLTRYACYLIAQNGDPRKAEIAFAQTYFAVQTRKQEIIEQRLAEVERIQAREKLSNSEKQLSGVLFERGVDGQGFARIRSKGDQSLFGGHTTQMMKTKLGVPDNRPLADFLPTITIKAKDFANEITNFNVVRDDLRNERDITEVEAAIWQEKESGIVEEQTKHIRVRYGVYSMRKEPGQYVLRLRAPAGILSSEQLEKIADLLDQYDAKTAHFTTRQGIQIAGIHGNKVGECLRKIESAGMTTRKTGGNVVRNIVCCPLSGITQEEVFDVTPYALVVDRYFREHANYQLLPRKIKIAFESCTKDHVRTIVSDIGLRAAVHDGQKGFHICVGGGLGVLPLVAQGLEDFTPLELLLPTLEAILRVFDQNGNRLNRMQARLKWLIRAQGIEWFRKTVFSEREKILSEEGRPYPQPIPIDEKSLSTPTFQKDSPGSKKFQEWKTFSLQPQEKKGFYTAMIHCVTGDLNATQIRRVAAASRQYGTGSIRTTIEQNIVLRWIPEASLSPLYQFLSKSGLVHCCAEQIMDITRCVGAKACISAVTNPLGACHALADLFTNGLQNDFNIRKLRIRISGCKNACSHHPMADIGLFGVAKRFYDKPVPCYCIYLGGQTENSKLSHHLTEVPACRMVKAVERLLNIYRNESFKTETFRAFVQRKGISTLRALLKNLTEVPPPEQGPEFYKDLDVTEAFKIEAQEGECHA